MGFGALQLGDGLEAGYCGLLVLFIFIPGDLFQKAADGAFGLIVAELGGWGEIAEDGVVGDFRDGGGCLGLLFGIGFRQVEAGDLETVEEEAGAAGIDVVGGDLLEHLADGEQDGAAVFNHRQGEGGSAGAPGSGILEGAAGGVVEVAKIFVALRVFLGSGAAEGGVFAAMAIGEDVAALEPDFVG